MTSMGPVLSSWLVIESSWPPYNGVWCWSCPSIAPFQYPLEVCAKIPHDHNLILLFKASPKGPQQPK